MEGTKKFIIELYPTTKLLFLLYVFITAVISEGVLYSYCLFLVSISIAILAGKGKSYLNITLKSLLPIALFILVMQFLFHPGENEFWSWGIFALTQEGISFGLNITSLILAIGGVSILMSFLMSAKDLIFSLEKMGISPKVTYVILATLQLIPEMRKLSLTIMDAQKTRGVEMEGSLLLRIKAFIPSLAPLFLTSIVSTEERAITLEARGFTVRGAKTNLYSLEKTKRDTTVRILLLFLLILFVIWRFMI